MRIPVSLPIVVAAIDNAGQEITTPALIINLSRGGASLQLPFETSHNSAIVLQWQNKSGWHKICVTPRWQRQEDDNWRMGVQVIEDNSIWRDLIYHACQNGAQIV